MRTQSRLLGQYTPMGMRGDPYSGELAQLLKRVANEKGFTSPHWVTKLGADKACIFIPDGTEGVTIHGHGLPFILYNVQQGSDRGFSSFITPKVSLQPDESRNLSRSTDPIRDLDHRTIENKLLCQSVSKKCEKELQTDKTLTTFWGTRSDFMKHGLTLRPGAQPLVDSFYNVSQCRDPSSALNYVRCCASASIKSLGGGLLPGDLAAIAFQKASALKARASAVLAILPHEKDLSDNLKLLSERTPEYFGTESDFKFFGTSLRTDLSLFATLTLLDAVGRVKLSSPLQLKNLFTRALEADIDFDVFRRLASVDKKDKSSDQIQIYFPSTLVNHPDLFNSYTCSRFLSPLHADTNVILSPFSVKSPPESVSFPIDDRPIVTKYRQTHGLYKSQYWVEVSDVEKIGAREGRPSINDANVLPCVGLTSGKLYFNLEQLFGYSLSPNFENEILNPGPLPNFKGA